MTPVRGLAALAFFASGVLSAQFGEVLINPLRDENGDAVLEMRQAAASTISIPESEATVIMSLFTGEDGSTATTPASVSIPESEATIIMSVLPTDSLSTSASTSDLTLTHESARTGPTVSVTPAITSAPSTAANNGVPTSVDTELLRLGLPVVLFIAVLWAM